MGKYQEILKKIKGMSLSNSQWLTSLLDEVKHLTVITGGGPKTHTKKTPNIKKTQKTL